MDDDKKDDVPDLDALAREYMTLWQRQLADTASDETLAKTMSDAMRLMTAGATQMAAQMTAAAQAAGGGANRNGNSDGSVETGGASSGPQAAGASHCDDDGVLDELYRRIAALEERIEALESRARAARRKARPDRGGSSRR